MFELLKNDTTTKLSYGTKRGNNDFSLPLKLSRQAHLRTISQVILCERQSSTSEEVVRRL